MSDKWIETRVLDAVDGDEVLAMEILDNYVSVLSKIDRSTGGVTFLELDHAAVEIGPWP